METKLKKLLKLKKKLIVYLILIKRFIPSTGVDKMGQVVAF
jgi:hypothetical protein